MIITDFSNFNYYIDQTPQYLWIPSVVWGWARSEGWLPISKLESLK
jgi:hypothetical protein